MKPLYDLFTGLLSILALGIGAFLINVLLHELGHAVPRLFWTKDKVAIFVGSLGDSDGSFRLSLGRLKVYITHNPFLWMRGLCQSGERLPVGKAIICMAMGPVVSLLLTVVPFVLLKTIEPDRQQTIILVTFLVVGGMFTYSSAIPRNQLSSTHTGRGIYNDAAQIIRLWKTRQLPPLYGEAVDKLAATDYPAAAEMFEKIIKDGYSTAPLYRAAVAAHFHAGQFERAQALQQLIRERYRTSLEDKIVDGCLLLLQGRYRDAAAQFRALAGLHNNHFLIMNNTGCALIAAGEAKNALMYLDRGITLAPRFAELYANRAWAMMEQGAWEEGLADAEKALKINQDSAGAYYALGLYARKEGDLQTARERLLKAQSLAPRMPFIEEDLADVERRLQAPGGTGV